MAKKAAAKKQPADESYAVPLVWVGLEDIPARAANNAMIQHHEDLFILTFGFTNPPVLTGTEANRRKQIKEIDAVLVTPFSRVTLTEAQLEKTIKALQTNLRQYRKQKDTG